MRKITVGVLMGGRSIEREVSLNSGRTICDHLDTARYIVVPIFQTHAGDFFILPERFLHRGKIADFESRLATQAEKITLDALSTRIDFAYIAMHGRYAEDGILQGALEVLSIPYFGSKIFASSLGMNKVMQKVFLAHAGVSVARDVTVAAHTIKNIQATQDGTEINLLLDSAGITYPLVVKPCAEGSSFGVSVVRNPADLLAALHKASVITNGLAQPVLIEEKIEGMEFSCIVITHLTTGELLPLPPTEIVLEDDRDFFDYEQKYMPGRAHKYTPARCTELQKQLIQQASMQAMRALGMTNMARIDGFLTPDNRVIIIDPNSFSGMAPSSFAFLQAAYMNMSHTDFINHLIETDLQAYGMLSHAVVSSQGIMSMHDKKIRVAVLLGGASAEREISLESGRNIAYKLSPHKYHVIPVFVSSSMKLYAIDQQLLVCNSTAEIESKLNLANHTLWTDLPRLVDFVFIGLHGGLGENGGVQGMLEMIGMPYNGSSVLTSALCMDKFKTTTFLREQHFAVPCNVLIDRTQQLPISIKALFGDTVAYPLIVKPHDDGCSVLVFKAHSDEQLTQAVQEIFATGRTHVLIEECIIGTELTVGVIGNDDIQALPASQAIAQGGILSIEEKFLPGAGENQTPALLPADVLALVKVTMERAYRVLQCKGYARIDCFYQTAAQSPTGCERVVILEVNTLPGMTPATCIFHQAAELGIKPMDFIDKIITYGFEAHGHAGAAAIAEKQPLAYTTT